MHNETEHQNSANTNKANLRDLIAATGLVIFNDFSARVTLKSDGWPRKIIGHLFYTTTSSFVHHFKSISELKPKSQSGNAQFGSKLGIFLSRVTLKFDRWPWKITGHLFYVASSFVHHFIAISWFKLELQSRNAQFGLKSMFFVRCDLEIWQMTLENKMTPLLYYIKLCASFQSHGWIQTGVTVRKLSIRVKIGNFFVLCDLEIWLMTLKNNRAPLLCCFKLCASFLSHQWIKTRVTVRKNPIWVKIDDFFLAVWPWNLTDVLEKQ